MPSSMRRSPTNITRGLHYDPHSPVPPSTAARTFYVSESTGDDADDGLNLTPRGDGRVRVLGTQLALGDAGDPPDTSGVVDAPTKAVLDALIVLLQTARIAS